MIWVLEGALELGPGGTIKGEDSTGEHVSVFIVAGNRLLREALARILKKRADIKVLDAVSFSSETVSQVAKSGAQVLLSDSVTSAPPHFLFVREVIRAVPSLRVIMVDMEQDDHTFLESVRAGAVGYVLKDASAMDVVAAVRAVAQDQAVCPPRLCLALFRYLTRESSSVPSVRLRVSLRLTSRQQQLVPLIARGLSNKEIASHLNVSEQTIKNHIHRMLRKTGADDRLAVVEMVRSQGALV